MPGIASLTGKLVDSDDRTQQMADYALASKFEMADLSKRVRGENIKKAKSVSSLIDETFRLSGLTPPDFDTDED